MKTIFRILLIALFFALIAMGFISCDIYKKSDKTKNDVDYTESIQTKATRKGDTVVFKPVLSIKYKDTTIYTYNRQGTTIKTIYDHNGQVSQVDCYASVVEMLINENRRLSDQSKTKQDEKKEEMNTDWIMYGFIMIGVVLIVALILIFWYIKSQTASILSVLSK